MDETKEKFIVHPRKLYGESKVVSARLPASLIRELDDVAIKTGRTRNELISLCIHYALKNLEISKD